jgi:hypothetical protein
LLGPQVHWFTNRQTGEVMPNFWLIAIAADGFPLRDGVGAFQLGLQVLLFT